VFCRFIETAEYVGEALRDQVPKGVAVESVTGTLPPADREQRVADLGKAGQRVLVCTDCLSEGVNLQDHFNAVIHYDLSWNPTRHEQREGRVDRYGQPSDQVKVITYYSPDNRIDGIVLDVLLRKHKTIRNALGISVPVPVDSNQVMQAIMEGLLLRKRGGGMDTRQMQFDIQFYKPEQEKLHTEWEYVAEREKRSRTMFAQESIKVDEVRRELDAVRAAIGSGVDVARFVKQAMELHHATFTGHNPVRINFKEAPRALGEMLRQVTHGEDEIKARFELPVKDEEIYLSRTHPVVEALSTFIMDSAFDSQGESAARRCGVIRTCKVSQRTTCLLLRFRYHIVTTSKNGEQTLLAEDSQVAAFTGSPASATWLQPDAANALLQLTPDTNIAPDIARQHLRSMLDGIAAVRPHLDDLARERGKELLDSHQRARVLRGVQHRVEPKLPVDILGLYVFLP
jgi:hypothetical protein